MGSWETTTRSGEIHISKSLFVVILNANVLFLLDIYELRHQSVYIRWNEQGFSEGNVERENEERGNVERGNVERGNVERGNVERRNVDRGNVERGNVERGNVECGTH